MKRLRQIKVEDRDYYSQRRSRALWIATADITVSQHEFDEEPSAYLINGETFDESLFAASSLMTCTRMQVGYPRFEVIRWSINDSGLRSCLNEVENDGSEMYRW
jgi:hypothetical protein